MEQFSLFQKEVPQPLAARLRPQTLDEFVGQTHLLGPGKVLRRLIESDQVSSMIFWGPPGVGKTTLARIIANRTKSAFIDFSAVTSGIREIRTVMQQAEENRRFGDRTILFVDEIHRFNKAQQDAFLPFVEKGSIILIGATTENPSFEINGALLSRCKVFVLQALKTEELAGLLRRAVNDPRGFGKEQVDITDEMLNMIAVFSNGDARNALSTLEMVVLNGDMDDQGRITVTKETLEQCISKKSLLYDVRQERRGALQPDLCPPQVHAQLRPGRCRVLAGPDAGSRRGPAVRGPTGGPLRQRRRGPGRSPCHRDRRSCLSGLSFHRYAGVQRPPDRSGGIYVHGPHRTPFNSWTSRCP